MKTLLRPIEAFLQSEARGGFVLFGFAVVAFVLANSPWSSSYFALKDTLIKLSVGEWKLEKPLVVWINDLLMVLFFLLVGLEIKRELVQGELKNPRAAALTVTAALGGAIAPALIYAALSPGGEAARGWGVAMATDIAFAVGVLSLLGKRVPLSLKVFLTAFAIVDDLGAVMVIAFFYTAQLNLTMLGWAALIVALCAVAGLGLRVRWLPLYFLLGLLLWYFILKSGVHSTIAGVLLALCIPISVPVEPKSLQQKLLLSANQDPEDFEAELHYLESDIAQAQSPLHRLEHLLSPWVAFLVLPVFAFFNAGVSLQATQFGPVSLAVLLGLLVGKPLGIGLACWLAVRAGLAQLPGNLGWGQILAAGILGGIGFTMALFVADLAFAGSALLDQAKLGVLAASALATAVGIAAIRLSNSRQNEA
jgi:NhaA family Na+:H+ antiporter